MNDETEDLDLQIVENMTGKELGSESVSLTGKIRAYRPGSWGELPLPAGNHIAVVLNDYHIRNLRWLLRHAWHGRAPEYLNTGDWCGEILWALEQAMLDSGLTGQNAWANGPDGGWPIDGYQVEVASKLHAILSTESADVR